MWEHCWILHSGVGLQWIPLLYNYLYGKSWTQTVIQRWFLFNKLSYHQLSQVCTMSSSKFHSFTFFCIFVFFTLLYCHLLSGLIRILNTHNYQTTNISTRVSINSLKASTTLQPESLIDPAKSFKFIISKPLVSLHEVICLLKRFSATATRTKR